MRVIGLRNIVTTKDRWYYLVFYDFDGYIPDWMQIADKSRFYRLSYILYKTKHGAHYVSFTPLTITRYASIFDNFDEQYGGYFSGQTIRLSRKADEEQSLVFYNLTNGEVIPQIYNIFSKRFKLAPLPVYKTAVPTSKKYQIVFERYETDKV